jgi:hypothetical protein
MASARFEFSDKFDLFDEQVRKAAEQALGHAAGAGVAVARAKETRVKTGALRSGIGVTRATRTGGGRLQVEIVGRDFKTLFHELGTNTRRRRKLAKSTLRRRSSASGQARQVKVAGHKGVKPLYFLRAGLKVATQRLVPELKRSMPR